MNVYYCFPVIAAKTPNIYVCTGWDKGIKDTPLKRILLNPPPPLSADPLENKFWDLCGKEQSYMSLHMHDL